MSGIPDEDDPTLMPDLLVIASVQAKMKQPGVLGQLHQVPYGEIIVVAFWKGPKQTHTRTWRSDT